MGRKGFRCNRNFLFRLHFNYTPLETLSYQRFACNRNFIFNYISNYTRSEIYWTSGNGTNKTKISYFGRSTEWHKD